MPTKKQTPAPKVSSERKSETSEHLKKNTDKKREQHPKPSQKN